MLQTRYLIRNKKRESALFTSDPDFTNYAEVLPLTIHTPRK